MQQGLIDIRKKAKELATKSSLGILEPYPISCGTLIDILDELEAAQHSVQPTADWTCQICKHVNKSDWNMCDDCKHRRT